MGCNQALVWTEDAGHRLQMLGEALGVSRAGLGRALSVLTRNARKTPKRKEKWDLTEKKKISG